MTRLLSLLIFNDQISSSSPATLKSSRCVSVAQVDSTLSRFQRRHLGRFGWVSPNTQDSQDTRTCEQTAAEMRGELSNRSLSPWKYSVKTEDNRIPYAISFAECLCKGCIIGRREDHNYNSVLVSVSLMVMKKSRCPGEPDKYRIDKEFINVPVACTCAVPKYTKGS
ncbi:interleukin-17C-like [Anoplopoma fimbria]|uniref:interleukin-17C-like n=1 Tax=Anoplopoma fimbria TaxID=229290 RepID=UPI0023ED8E24|nr:interleukin-17C-like [Anoplopoma fimbria]